jgi:hypothetical protein
MPAGPNTGTVRTSADFLELYADYKPAKSSNRQLMRDFVQSFDVIRSKDVYVDDAPYFAPADGTDATAAFNAAIAALPLLGGGRIICKQKQYAVNLVINRNNIQIVSDSGSDWATQNRLVPFNPAIPCVQVGDGSVGFNAFAYDTQIENICIHAAGPNGTGTIGLLITGAQRASYRRVNVRGFTKWGIRFQSGANLTWGSVARHYFHDCHVQGDPKYCRALISFDYNAGGAGALQYVTAVYFSNLGCNANVWGVTGRTATSGAVGALNDSGAAWNVNEWAGMAVTIVSGTGIGQTRDIASNTATQLVPTVNFAVAPDATSRYEIVGYVIENDGCEVGFTDSYLDVTSWRSVRLNKDGATSPFILGNNLNIDGAASTDIVLQTPYNSANSLGISNYAIGLINIDGYVLASDGTTFHPTGRQYLYNQAQHVYPEVFGIMTFQGLDVGDASSLNQMGPSTGHASNFQIITEATLNLKPGSALIQMIAPASTMTLTLFETTGSFSGTLRVTGGVTQLFSQASKNLDLIAGGASSAAKMTINFNCGPVLPTYAKASLPTAIAGGLIYVSDWPQGKRIAHFDSGTSWRPINNPHQTSKGDADVTLQYDTDVELQNFSSNLTANRTVTLSTAGVTPRGARFSIRRSGGGAFSLDIGPGIKTLTAANQFAQFWFDSVAWQLEFYVAF